MTENREIDEVFMRDALEEARAAAGRGEVPIGAVITVDGAIVARAGNRTITDCDPTAHAEIIVLREAATAIRNYRLLGATLYVSIEPKGGAVRSCFSILEHPQINHRVEVTPGLLADEAAVLLRNFFAVRR
jgi:tRNA(adenine34) deaminase